MYFNEDIKGLHLYGCGCGRRGCSRCKNIIVSPTETIIKKDTNKRVVKNIHPTEVINVNRTVIRNEHFYPVTKREVNETIIEDYDCGNDVRNPSCRRRVSGNNNCSCNRHHHGCRKK